MKALDPLLPVTHSALLNGSKNHLNLPLLGPYPQSLDTVCANDRLNAQTGATAVHMLLKQLAHQLQPSFFKLSLQLAKVHFTNRLGIKERYDTFKILPSLAIEPFKARQRPCWAHRPLPPVPEASYGNFYQRIDQYGFHLGAVAHIRPVHPAAACGLSQFDPIVGSIAASVEPLSINEGLQKQWLKAVLPLPVEFKPAQ